METRIIEILRETKETQIRLTLDMSSSDKGTLNIAGVPFFGHILQSLSFHGRFRLDIEASGDIDVDPHHLVEDTGLVLGDALRRTVEEYGPVQRFGHQVIPMDEALSETVIDVCGRPYLNFQADFPQDYAGIYPVALNHEFLLALTNRAGISLHALCRYGMNSHHMTESLFKALGRSLKQAYTLLDETGQVLSTKGVL